MSAREKLSPQLKILNCKRDSMSKRKNFARRIIAVILMALGLLLGVTWNSKKYCVGDEIFLALGMAPWSNGSSGTHYPAVVGSLIIIAGMCILNSTLQKKARVLLWAAVSLSLVLYNLVFTYM